MTLPMLLPVVRPFVWTLQCYATGLDAGEPELILHALDQACQDVELAALLEHIDTIYQDRLCIQVTPEETQQARRQVLSFAQRKNTDKVQASEPAGRWREKPSADAAYAEKRSVSCALPPPFGP